MTATILFGDQIAVFSHPEQIEITVYEQEGNQFGVRINQVRRGQKREIAAPTVSYPSFEAAVDKTGEVLRKIVSRLPDLAKQKPDPLHKSFNPLHDFFHPDGKPLSKEEHYMDTEYLNENMIQQTLQKLQQSPKGKVVSVFIKQ